MTHQLVLSIASNEMSDQLNCLPLPNHENILSTVIYDKVALVGYFKENMSTFWFSFAKE